MSSPSNLKRNRKSGAVFTPSLIALAVALICQPASAVLDIPNAPLQSAAAIPSNILYILDDSGSMQFEMMPDDLTIWPGENPIGDLGYGVYLFPPPNRTIYGSDIYGQNNTNWRLIPTFSDTNFHNYYKRSAANNTIFYDPSITYTPWVKYDGTSYGNASPSAAPYHPANSGAGTLNLTSQQSLTANWISGTSLTNGASQCGWSGTCSHSFWPITYYVYKGGSLSKTAAASYTKYQIQGNKGYATDLATGTTTTISGTFPSGRSVADEAQNFANWFSYYRSRTLAARAGSSIAFSKLGINYRVGFTTINTSDFGDAIPTSGVFDGTNRQTWFNNLFSNAVPTSGTPLKQALDRAGQYYSRTDNTGPYGPAPQLSCRRNFTILTTDGYYGETTISGIGNDDGTAGSTITGTNSQSYKYSAVKPYQDSYTNTLADIAMYYWKNDLRTDLTNNMRATSTNPSFWQNMNTFTLSLGPQGTLNPATDLARLTAGTATWPDPLAGDAQKIDDLWHAAVNGRGSFVAAKNPTEFANGLVSALTTIGEAGGVWNVAVTAFTLEADGKTFVARYDGNWGGDLWAVGYNANGQMNTTSDGTPIPVWKASANVPAPASRKIYTWKDSGGGGGTTFEYTNLSSSKKSALGSSAVVDYLRGVRTGEVSNGGAYRNRTSVIGDFANPAPVYVKASNTIFAAANDGMLHAFNASTGVEQFAYIPGSVNFTTMATLANPNYSHAYLNDGEVVVSDLATVGKNILVGSLGRAGKGIYALDVTTPSSFGTSNVLWEYTDSDLGQTLGKPLIARLNTGDWAVIIGNGYNSTNEKAFLYIINLNTGALIKKIATGAGSSSATNGLSSLVGFDKDGDSKIDLIYAGDLLGNFWRFNLAGTDTSAWSGTSMFTARDASNNTQPITGGLAVAIDPKTNKRWVFGGTGRYLTNGDVSDTAIQSWYGLIDDGTTIAGRSALTQRTLTAETAQGSYLTRTFSEATTNDMVGKSGWYVDMAVGGVRTGERIVSRSQYSAGVLYASSVVPSTDKCASGGTGYINALSAFSGATITKPFFDINNDNAFDDADKKLVGGKLTPAGSVRTGGMIGEITIKKVTDSKFTIQSCDSTGVCKAQPNVNLSELKGRVSWREIRKE